MTRGCVAFSTEPNTRKVQFREGIDSPQALASSALGEIGPLLLEDDTPAELFSISEGSRNGKGFIAANGDRIRNEGEVHLNLEAANGSGGVQGLKSTFQSARVSRPLMSVSQICDHGFKCIFEKDRATVVDSDLQPRFVCERRGGLYTAPMKLKAPPPPAPFQRQAP